jgi:hypothetical protein
MLRVATRLICEASSRVIRAGLPSICRRPSEGSLPVRAKISITTMPRNSRKKKISMTTFPWIRKKRGAVL